MTNKPPERIYLHWECADVFYWYPDSQSDNDPEYIRADVVKALVEAGQGLVEYRSRNTENFQLEKADDFINNLAAALEKLKEM